MFSSNQNIIFRKFMILVTIAIADFVAFGIDGNIQSILLSVPLLLSLTDNNFNA